MTQGITAGDMKVWPGTAGIRSERAAGRLRRVLLTHRRSKLAGELHSFIFRYKVDVCDLSLDVSWPNSIDKDMSDP